MKGLGNDNQIAYIQIHKEDIYPNIKYYEQVRNFWGQITVEEGFYKNSTHYNQLMRVNKLNDGLVYSDKIVLEKSHIILEYSNGREEKIYFNSDKEMYVYLKREFQGNYWRKFD